MAWGSSKRPNGHELEDVKLARNAGSYMATFGWLDLGLYSLYNAMVKDS